MFLVRLRRWNESSSSRTMLSLSGCVYRTIIFDVGAISFGNRLLLFVMFGNIVAAEFGCSQRALGRQKGVFELIVFWRSYCMDTWLQLSLHARLRFQARFQVSSIRALAFVFVRVSVSAFVRA